MCRLGRGKHDKRSLVQQRFPCGNRGVVYVSLKVFIVLGFEAAKKVRKLPRHTEIPRDERNCRGLSQPFRGSNREKRYGARLKVP